MFYYLYYYSLLKGHQSYVGAMRGTSFLTVFFTKLATSTTYVIIIIIIITY